MSGLMPWGSWRAFLPPSNSLTCGRLADLYSDDSRYESGSLGPATLSKSADPCLDSLVLSLTSAPHVYSLINLICVYAIHTSWRITVVARARISSLTSSWRCTRSALVLAPFHPFAANQHVVKPLRDFLLYLRRYQIENLWYLFCLPLERIPRFTRLCNDGTCKLFVANYREKRIRRQFTIVLSISWQRSVARRGR